VWNANTGTYISSAPGLLINNAGQLAWRSSWVFVGKNRLLQSD
jgi:hypothetical protein